MDKLERLALDIERGLRADLSPLVLVEDRGSDLIVIGQKCLACALCIAAIGRFGTVQITKDSYRTLMDFMDRGGEKASHIEILANLANCDLEVAKAVQHAHTSGMKAAQIATDLRAGTLPAWRPR